MGARLAERAERRQAEMSLGEAIISSPENLSKNLSDIVRTGSYFSTPLIQNSVVTPRYFGLKGNKKNPSEGGAGILSRIELDHQIGFHLDGVRHIGQLRPPQKGSLKSVGFHGDIVRNFPFSRLNCTLN
jgi:hypothetical protein